MEKVINIPKELSKRGELVIIPRADYEEFLLLRKIVPLVKMGATEKKAIKKGRKQVMDGEYLNFKQLRDELGC